MADVSERDEREWTIHWLDQSIDYDANCTIDGPNVNDEVVVVPKARLAESEARVEKASELLGPLGIALVGLANQKGASDGFKAMVADLQAKYDEAVELLADFRSEHPSTDPGEK